MLKDCNHQQTVTISNCTKPYYLHSSPVLTTPGVLDCPVVACAVLISSAVSLRWTVQTGNTLLVNLRYVATKCGAGIVISDSSSPSLSGGDLKPLITGDPCHLRHWTSTFTERCIESAEAGEKWFCDVARRDGCSLSDRHESRLNELQISDVRCTFYARTPHAVPISFYLHPGRKNYNNVQGWARLAGRFKKKKKKTNMVPHGTKKEEWAYIATRKRWRIMRSLVSR